MSISEQSQLIIIEVPYFTIYTFKVKDVYNNAKFLRIQSKPFVKTFKIKSYKDAEKQIRKDYPHLEVNMTSMLESFETKKIEIII